MLNLGRANQMVKKKNELLNQVSSTVKTMVINGERPLYRNGWCTVNGDIVTSSYAVHRALLLLHSFNQARKKVEPEGKDIKELELEDLNFADLM